MSGPHSSASSRSRATVPLTRFGQARQAGCQVGDAGRLGQRRDRLEHLQRREVEAVQRAHDRGGRRRPGRERAQVGRHRVHEVRPGAQQHGESSSPRPRRSSASERATGVGARRRRGGRAPGPTGSVLDIRLTLRAGRVPAHLAVGVPQVPSPAWLPRPSVSTST